MHIERMESTESLSAMKESYVAQAVAPLDGMWLDGFVPMARHFGIRVDEELVGYFCINEEGYLLQFYLDHRCQSLSTEMFEQIVARDDSGTGQIKGAFVSTAEPHFLSLCLDHFSKFEVNALMYQQNRGFEKPKRGDFVSLISVESTQLSQTVDFAVENIGAPAEWLTGYYENLIDRNELYGVWKNDRLVATGESRRKDKHQTECVDIGVIVARSERGKRMATKILKQLASRNKDSGLRSICSTERTNHAAQKAIVRAGFSASNRIIQFHASCRPTEDAI